MSEPLTDPLYERIRLIDKIEDKINDGNHMEININLFKTLYEDNPNIIYSLLFENCNIDLLKIDTIRKMNTMMDVYQSNNHAGSSIAGNLLSFNTYTSLTNKRRYAYIQYISQTCNMYRITIFTME